MEKYVVWAPMTSVVNQKGLQLRLYFQHCYSNLYCTIPKYKIVNDCNQCLITLTF